MKESYWYKLDNPGEIDTPALLIFKNRVAANIQTMISIAGDAKRLVPHVKTHKMAEVVKMQLNAGISQFKCATISEAEMLAEAGAKNIILAYQLTFVKAKRFLSLIKKYPGVQFFSLIDNRESAEMMNNVFEKESLKAHVFFDVDAGMHRTGIAPEKLPSLFSEIRHLTHLHFEGLHVYDGHIRESDFEKRKEICNTGFEKVILAKKALMDLGFSETKIIAGGTPTFTVHALNKEVSCSPGTCLLWDYGYGSLLTEQPFEFAAVLMTRIISKPAPGLITTDLGHKSVAAENPISKRIIFLNLTGYEVRSQSEEHLVVHVEDDKNLKVGDVLYGIPYHVCPTVALHDEANIIEDGKLVDKWNVAARKRKISV